MLTVLRPMGLACCLMVAAGAQGSVRPSPGDSSESAWARAVELRTQFEASPANQHTKEQFEALLNVFRDIYHQHPGAAKAPAAVAAVADLLAEKGRVLADPRASRAALGQYEFLRQQYPRSPQVESVMLLEAEVCRQDLKDLACAEEKFRAVIAAVPGSSFAEQAALELDSMKTTGPAASNSAASQTKPETKPEPRPEPKPDMRGSTAEMRAAPAKPAPELPPVAEASASAQPPAAPSAGNSGTGSSRKIVAITGMRHWSNPTSTRIAIDLGGKVEYEAARVQNPDRIFFDLHGARLASGLNGHQVEVVDDGYLKRIRAAQFMPNVTRVVLDVTDVTEYSAFLLPDPWRLIIDIHSDKVAAKGAEGRGKDANGLPPNQPSTPAPAASRHKAVPAADSTIADVAGLSSEPTKVEATARPTSEPVSAHVPVSVATTSKPEPAAGQAVAPTGQRRGKKRRNAVEPQEAQELPHAAEPTADGQRSLVRALGLKVGRIVIDAGHGGHDSGTLGPGGIEEKDVVLDVALRTGKLLHQRLGAEIVYTRSDDTFIPLETRTAIANKAQADLFLSIHGNSSQEPSARGVETYYLNFTSDPNALEVAARENAVSSQSVHQLSDLVRKITLKDKIDESREFAADVDAGLFAGLRSGNTGLKDRGVKKAPFVVLIGAQMPSILAEISFITNPDDAEQLQTGSYRQRIAQALDAGVERYLNGLSGLRARSDVSDTSIHGAERTTVVSKVEPSGR